jgi:hypothetical protein
MSMSDTRVALARSLAQGDEPTAFVALEVDFGDRHLCADDGRSEREASDVFECLSKRPELLVRSVRIDRDVLDQRIDGVVLVPHQFSNMARMSRV